MSSMATRHVLAALADAAVSAGVPRVEIESVGGVDAARRIAAGEEFDLVFLASDAVDALAADAHVDAESVHPLLISQVAAAVPSGSDHPAPAVSDDAFADQSELIAALRAARQVGYSTGPSGTALVRMIDQWGLSAEVGDKLEQSRPGIPVARSLADGDVDLGFQQLSELVGQPGIRILGVLPEDCAITTTFSGAVTAMSSDPTAAAEVLAFFRTAAAASFASEYHFGTP